MRRWWTWGLIAAGVLLMAVSYFFLAAPWGEDTVANSDPRLQFAPLLFVVGVIAAFSAALVYELLPDRTDE